jgi:hypothetical protein
MNLKMVDPISIIYNNNNNYSYSVALVREQTIPTERPPLVGEVNANLCGQKGVAWSE